MKAVILVGGEGTRLRPLTNNTVKAMVPVLNRPFIQHVIEHLKKHHIDTFILAMGYKPDSLKKYFDINSIPDTTLVYSVEPEPLGTAGAVKYAQQHISDNEPFFVLNGDILTDLDLTDMLAFHRRQHAKVTISLTPVDDPSRYGVVETDAYQHIKQFVEKPKHGEATTNLINAGVYILEPEVLERIPYGKWSMFEHDVFPQMIAESEPVYGYSSNTYWIDMGTPDKYMQLNFDLLCGEFSPIKSRHENTHGEQQSYIPSDAILEGPVYIDSGCKIGKNVMLKGPVIIGPNCTIYDNAAVEKSILWHNVIIGNNTAIKNSIILDGNVVADNINIDNTIITGTDASEEKK